jgi:hypothetical protein
MKEEAMALEPKNPIPFKTANPTYSQPTATDQSRKLNGFERPSYFGGHLLTDADLTLEQRYFREKKKLYHRALDGHGIVCGLRLTCDPDHPGAVLVGKGYAIDDYGNDLVLPQPRHFDVVGPLIEKGLILRESSSHRPERGMAKPERHVRQSFYVAICYQEEQVDFATPLVATSQPSLGACEPTRIRETVQLDVVDTLPVREDAGSAVKRRLESCFKLFSPKEAFGRALQDEQNVLNDIFRQPQAATLDVNSCHKLFFDLRGQLLLYLKRHPDQYNLTIEDEIRKVEFPDKQSEAGTEGSTEIRDAFFSLLALAWQHAVSGALGALVPLWREPSGASRVSLGTVTVENGRVVCVCNCPRSYVWSFANFPEVLLATALGGLACNKKDEADSATAEEAGNANAVGCREFEFVPECFLQWLSVNQKAPFYASTELLQSIETFAKSIQEGFDFTDPCNFSARIFEGMNNERAAAALDSANIRSRVAQEPLVKPRSHPAAVMGAASLVTGRKTIVLTTKEGVVTSAVAEHPGILGSLFNHLQNQINFLKQQLERPPQKPAGGPGPGVPPPR